MTDPDLGPRRPEAAPAVVRPERVEIDEDVLSAGITDERLLEVYRGLAPTSALVVPLRARSQVLGVLALFCDGSGRSYDDEDLVTAADLARRAALTVDNARLYSREHEVAGVVVRRDEDPCRLRFAAELG